MPMLPPGGKPFKGAVLRETGDQSIPDTTITILEWDGVDFDTDGFFDSEEPTRITIPAGIKKVRLHFYARTGAGGGQLWAYITKNGESGSGGRYGWLTSSGDNSVAISEIVEVNAGDYFEAVIRIDGGPENLFEERSHFSVEVIE